MSGWSWELRWPRRRGIQLAVGVAVAVLLLLLPDLLGLAPPVGFASWLLLAAFLLPWALAHEFLHGLAHVAAARRFDFTVGGWRLGPVLRRRRQSLAAGGETALDGFPGLGTVLTRPRDPARLRRDHVLVTTAGPVADLVILIALGLLTTVFPPGQAATTAAFMTGVSGLLTLLHILPFDLAGRFSDGGLLLLWRSYPDIARQRVAASALAQLPAVQRPRAWDAAWIVLSCSHPDGSEADFRSRLLAVERAIDLGVLDDADEPLAYLRRYAELLPGSIRAHTFLTAAYLATRRGEPAADAQALLGEARAILDSPNESVRGSWPLLRLARRRAEAAVRLAEGDYAAAAATAREQLALLHENPPSVAHGWLQAFRSQLSDLLAEAQPHLPSGGSGRPRTTTERPRVPERRRRRT